MKGIENQCQLLKRCDGHEGGAMGWRGKMAIGEVLGGMGSWRLDRKCDSPKRCERYKRGVSVDREV